MKIKGTEFLIGADPELFIMCIATGKLVSAHGMIPGTKEKPFKVRYGAVQVDGMAAEFNIDPAKTKAQFIRNVVEVKKQLQEMIGDKYKLVSCGTAYFGKELIDEQPLEAKILGCDPDYDAWTGEQNPVPDVELPFRTAAGHIHIGWTNGQDPFCDVHLQVCQHLIKHLDYWTIPTTLVDTDFTRRDLYGNAGAYRPKSYGVEYRTPSNFWTKDRATIGVMYDLVKHAIHEVVLAHRYTKLTRKLAVVGYGVGRRCIRNGFLGEQSYRFTPAGILEEIEEIGYVRRPQLR